ncbi:uncharacterized protein LY79DRAFT_411075 [Colletotrichum navitas]|uniref:Uncharacterized protein n=1 Tax=Colletotrichum navitas TaxID=681940 RepID=A0AAD8V0Q0_9PEZI|nr:uncharacterized protein LY79DRAFT_411075 [Colletotrichum navitas]KAK1573494.1 hypothetical protein LY79DRAFT_411075 [Colletotrichum navitas]
MPFIPHDFFQLLLSSREKTTPASPAAVTDTMCAMASSPPRTPIDIRDNDFESLSIASIIRSHPHERLFVRPLHWTLRHVNDLLGCSFIHHKSSPPLSRLSPPSSPNRKLDSSTVLRAQTTTGIDVSSPKVVPRPHPSPNDQHVRILAQGRSLFAKAAALSALVSNGPAALERTSKQLIFHFDGHSIPMPASIFSRPQPTLPPGGTLPILAFLHRLDIQRSREASLEYILCPPPSRRPSSPTARLYDKRLAQTTPSDPLQDPYILAMLIALAQSQQRQYARARLLSTTQSFQVCLSPLLSRSSIAHGLTPTLATQVHVIVSDTKVKSHLVLYTADVPSVFLDRLTSPHKRPHAAHHLAIRSIDIPFQPYSSFLERLTQTVVPPSPKRS